VGEYGLFSKINNFQDFFNKFQRNNLNLGVQVRIPLMSADRSARVTLARSELTVAEIQLRNKRENVELEISRQFQHVRELDAAREVARLERDVAQENLRVVQAGFDEGRVKLPEVENARLSEHDKWIAFSDSDFAYKKAHLELLNTTGELTRLFEQKP
jgi:outer membrane protein TolC